MCIQISSGKGPDECELALSLFLKPLENELHKLHWTGYYFQRIHIK